MSALCDSISFIHRNCKNKLDHDKKIQSLNSQVMQLLTQIEELKAINNYQTFELEQKIAALEEERVKIKEVISEDKVKNE